MSVGVCMFEPWPRHAEASWLRGRVRCQRPRSDMICTRGCSASRHACNAPFVIACALPIWHCAFHIHRACAVRDVRDCVMINCQCLHHPRTVTAETLLCSFSSLFFSLSPSRVTQLRTKLWHAQVSVEPVSASGCGVLIKINRSE